MDERRRQEKLLRKKRKREEKRTAHARHSAALASPDIPEWVLDRPKMSDTLMAFAAPLFDAQPSPCQAEEVERPLLLAMAAWNSALAFQGDALEAELQALSRGLSGYSLAPPEIMLTTLRALAERKRSHFPDDHRLVLDVRVQGTAPDFRILATSTLFKP
ncbi:MAG TPA: hypothetical protein VF815_26940 [Myxococcaceae bacterium]|jgi:hypothetical protein